MSYSVCINCKEMVPGYEKYCESCVRRYKLQQDMDYHKTPKRHLAKDDDNSPRGAA